MKAIVVVAAVALVVVLVVTVAGDCTWSQDITSRSWDESVCPEPYILIGNTTCLYISQWGVVRNWSAAQTYCSVYEGELAVINDCALLGEVWTLTQHVLNLTGNFWVGGSDAEAEGSWVWERTVKSVPMGVPFWLPGHPDGDTHENKLMIADNGYFTDGNQTEEHYFICQDFSTLGSITGCNAPYILIGSSCFYIPPWDVLRTWQDAQVYCIEGLLGELAVISDCDTLGQVWNWIRYDLNKTGSFWVGGSDSAMEGTWVWERVWQRVPMGVPYWLHGQPDGDEAENRLVISQNGFFDDENESQENYFICQYFLD